MSKLIWRDDTSRSRGDKSREVRIVSTDLGTMRLTVHRYLNIEGVWYASCLFFDKKQLAATSLEDAKFEALAAVHTACQLTLSAITKSEQESPNA